MFAKSKIVHRFITIVLLSMFALTSVPIINEASARQGKRDGKSYRADHRNDRSYARQRGRRHIYSPRIRSYGHAVKRLPRGYRRAWYGRTPYYYNRGIFYRPARSGFVVVGPPSGAVIVNLPVGYQRIWVGNSAYYTYGGVFYQRVPSGYSVVEAPPAVVIKEDAPVIVQPSETSGGTVSVTTDILNVRSGPGLKYPVIYQIHEGYVLEIHGKSIGWLYVEMPNGEFGWVMKGYTSLLENPGSG